VIGGPVRLSDSPVAAKRAPLKGEHTEDVLRTMAGYTPDQIQRFRDNNVI
jgi:crotonobetainyl-CoA:carnitine CoA-transferase CaiB-like acyl-CoA transferase